VIAVAAFFMWGTAWVVGGFVSIQSGAHVPEIGLCILQGLNSLSPGLRPSLGFSYGDHALVLAAAVQGSE